MPLPSWLELLAILKSLELCVLACSWQPVSLFFNVNSVYEHVFVPCEVPTFVNQSFKCVSDIHHLHKCCGSVILKSNLSFSLCPLVLYNAIAIQIDSLSSGNLVPFVFSLSFFSAFNFSDLWEIVFHCVHGSIWEKNHTRYNIDDEHGQRVTLCGVSI